MIHPDQYQPRLTFRRDLIARSHFPYCLQPHGALDGERAWLVLNREYKPIGFPTKGYYKYADYPIGIRPHPKKKRLWETCVSKLKRLEEYPFYFFFNDGCLPWSSRANRDRYLKLLGEFMMVPVIAVPLRESSLTAKEEQAGHEIPEP
jgi:hypothetical protein